MTTIKSKKIKPEALKVLNVDIEKPFNAKEVFEFLKDEVLNGHTNVYKAFLLFHQMGVILEMFKKDKDLKKSLEIAISNMGEQPFYGFVAKWISKKNYDYSACGDAVWQTMDEEIKALTEERKKREEHLLHYQGDEFEKPDVTYSNYAELRKAA